MRILANYGYKNNGDSYSVTFETTGDVPIEKASSTVDDLFKLAKEAIQRQIGSSDNGIDPFADFPENNNEKHYHQEKDEKTRSNDTNENNGKNNNAKITLNQKKFLYRLLLTNKKLSGEEATEFLKKELKIQYVNSISYSQADAFIKKILQESSNRGDNNGAYKRQSN